MPSFKVLCQLVFIGLLNLNAFCQIERGVKPVSKTQSKIGKSYAIIIGISNYKNVSDLQFADKDALAFKAYILKAIYPKIDSSDIEIFINEQATRVNVSDAISNLIKKAKPGDLIYFYFAGHGDIEDLTQSKNGLLLLYESPIENYFGMSDGVLQVGQIADYFGKLTAQNIDVNYIIDACHSGKLNGGEQGRIHTSKAIQYSLTEGSTLMLSCDADQLSIEGREWGGGRGLFSYSLELGMAGLADLDNDNLVSLFEIDQYVRKQTFRESDKKQIPIISGDFTKIISEVSAGTKDSIINYKNKELKLLTEVNFKVNEANYFNELDSLSQYYYNLAINLINQNHSYGSQIINACIPYRLFCNRNSNNILTIILKRKLIVALNENFDSLVKPILSGKSPTYSLVTLQKIGNELDSCIEIIDQSHYLFNNILSRKYIINAMLKVYNISINNYTNQNKDALLESIKLLHLSRSLEPNAAYTYILLGIKHQTMQSYDSSMIYFNQFAKLIPNSYFAFNLIGLSLFDIGKVDESIKAFNKAIELNKNYTPAYTNLISVYSDIKSFDKGVELAKKVIKINPGYISAYNNLSELYINSGRTEKAIETCLTAEKLSPTSMGPLLIRGKILFNRREFHLADTCFQKCLKLEGKKREVYKYLGLNYKALKQYRNAINCFSNYLKLDSTNTTFLSEIANCYELIGIKDSSELYYYKAISFLNKSNSNDLHKAIIYQFGLNNQTTAYEIYKSIDFKDNFYPEYLFSNLIFFNEFEKADSIFKSSVKNGLDQKKIEYMKACNAAKFGNEQNLYNNLKKIIEFDFTYIWKIQKDPIFINYINNPKFKHLIEIEN